MSLFVLDCSITMAWCFEDQGDYFTDEVLRSLGQDSALVPPLWFYEVANALLVAERRKKIKPADSAKFLDLLAELPISHTAPQASEKMVSLSDPLIALGRMYHLSAYDAVYLELAINQGLPMASRDGSLLKACKKTGVERWLP